MVRVATVLISFCLAIIAVSISVVARSIFGLALGETIAVGLSVVIVLTLLQAALQRARDHAQFERRIEELSHLEGTVTRTLQSLASRVGMLEERLDQELSPRGPVHVEAILEPVLRESEVLGTLVKQLAETVADLDFKIEQVAARGGAFARAEGPLPSLDASADHIRGLIEANSAEIFLQPIVTLPQRKPRHYEVLTRFREPGGTYLLATDFLPVAERAGLMPQIDVIALGRAVQVLKRLSSREREIGVFCNISAASLLDAPSFGLIMDLLKENVTLAARLVLEFRQEAVKGLGPLELESLGAMADLGFRFSMDGVTDLKVDFAELSRRGFRYAKLATSRLLATGSDAPVLDIHMADFAAMLSRNNIDLIVDRVETEAQVLDVLEFNVKFGQGYVFGPPRPVRVDVLGTESVTLDDGAKAPAKGGKVKDDAKEGAKDGAKSAKRAKTPSVTETPQKAPAKTAANA